MIEESQPLPSKVADWPSDWVDRALSRIQREECGSPIFALVANLSEASPRSWDETIVAAAAVDVPKALCHRRWIIFQAQTAGLCCYHHDVVFSPLVPSDAAFAAAVEIERLWHGSNLGRDRLLSGYREYFDMLGSKLEITHDVSLDGIVLEEALYPVPFVDENLSRLFPSLSEVERNQITQTNRDARTRWPLDERPKSYRLFILGANSD